jgi:FtsX-like permease family protein
MIALVLAMVWSRRGQAVTLALLAMFGVAAAVAAPAYLRVADRAVATGQVGAATPAERSLSLEALQHDTRHGAEYPGDVNLTETGATLAALAGFDYVYAAEFPTVGMDPDDHYRTRLVFRQDACPHLTMVAGRCLIGESDLVIGEQTARRLGLAPGETVTLTYAYRTKPPPAPVWLPDGRAKRFLIVGVYRPADPVDVYWGQHRYFTPEGGDRPGEPAFVTGASIATMDHGELRQNLDATAAPAALAVDRLPAVRQGLAALNAELTALGPAVALDSGVPGLLARIDAGRTAGHRIVPVLAVSLVLLACLTIYLAVGYGTAGRRPELALVALRGARWGQRWWLATGENLVAVLTGAIAGCVAGQLLVDAFAAWRFPGVGADPGLATLRWAPVATLAAILTAVAAERHQLGRPVVELLRRVPPSTGLAAAIAAEAVVVVLAAAAVGQLVVTGGVLSGVGTFATGLVLVAAALIAARLLLPWATVFARRQLRRGRLAAAVAGFQVSRRPGGARLFALLTAAVAVIGYAAAAVDVADRGRAEQAEVGTGASRVLSVSPVSRQGLLAAVHAADPGGAFAMAVLRLPATTDRPPVIAVDSARLPAVARWAGSGPGAVETRRKLRPAGSAPFPVRGASLAFDITAGGVRQNKPLTVTALLTPGAGLADVEVELGEMRPGRHTYAVAAPACAAADCQLKALRIAGNPGSLDVTGVLTVHAAGGVPVSQTSWRGTAGARISTVADGLRVEIPTLNGLPTGIAVTPGGVPYPMPVATAGVAALSEVTNLDGRSLPVADALRLDAVPGLGTPAVLADLDYLDRLTTAAAPGGTAQVWLAAQAPPEVLSRLTAAGLVVTADVRAGEVRAGLDEQGPALALWFYLLVAALAAALAAGALVLAAAVDRSRRIEDLSALRGQGLDRAAVRRATLWTYPVLVAAAVLAGTGIALFAWRLTGWALPLAGLDAPAFPLPALPRAGTVLATAAASFALLAGVAVVAGRRTLRSIR